VDGLAALKAEHRPLVAQIARDAGMSPETREMLLLHLNEEEEERVGQVQALTGAGPGATHADHALRLTVGSLRGAAPPPSGARVGSLRG
jgi:hypothetical protein